MAAKKIRSATSTCVREGDMNDLGSDIYMLSKGDRFFSVEWTTIGDTVRAVRGVNFKQDHLQCRQDDVIRSGRGSSVCAGCELRLICDCSDRCLGSSEQIFLGRGILCRRADEVHF